VPCSAALVVAVSFVSAVVGVLCLSFWRSRAPPRACVGGRVRVVVFVRVPSAVVSAVAVGGCYGPCGAISGSRWTAGRLCRACDHVRVLYRSRRGNCRAQRFQSRRAQRFHDLSPPPLLMALGVWRLAKGPLAISSTSRVLVLTGSILSPAPRLLGPDRD
jgi:hypothetical protein